MNYIFLLILALFSNDPDPQYPGCINGEGHVKHKVLYSIPDTTGLIYNFDTTITERIERTTLYHDTLEWLVIPTGIDTLVWNCVRCDSLQHTPSDSIRYLVRVKEDPKDLTPDAVNWTNVNFTPPDAFSNIQKIQGVDDDIRLKIEFTGVFDIRDNFYLYVNSNNNYIGSTGYSIKTSGQEVPIPKDKYIYFYGNVQEPREINLNVTVKNVSDDNKVIDTFTYIISGDSVPQPPPP